LNQKTKFKGGLHRPPNDRLTGRTGVGRILQCDRRTVRRLERAGILVPTVVEPNGVRWFDIEMVKRMAAMNRRAGKAVARKRSAPPPAKPTDPSDYRPELRGRRLEPQAPPSSPPRTQRSGEQGCGPRTQIRPEWWPNDDADPEPQSDDPTSASSKPPKKDPPSRN
jgi:hypothetical protein